MGIKVAIFFMSMHLLIEEVVLQTNPNLVRNEIRTLQNGASFRISYGKFEQFSNKRLMVNPLKRVFYEKETSCKTGCARTDGCISINTSPHAPNHIQCDMLDDDHFGKESRLINATGSNYFTIKVSHFFLVF